jgi:IPT/TIG domain-containing protein
MMATLSAAGSSFGKASLFSITKNGTNTGRGRNPYKRWMFLAAIVLFSSLAVAQNAPQVTGVDPASGKVSDTVTVSGSNLGKASVSSVYLSDDKNDFKATIVDQSDDKISVKIPPVKAGGYNISIQVGDKLFIKPVKFKVEE